VALSSPETEYLAAFHARCQALWLELLLEESPIQLNVDNKSSINLEKNPVYIK